MDRAGSCVLRFLSLPFVVITGQRTRMTMIPVPFPCWLTSLGCRLNIYGVPRAPWGLRQGRSSGEACKRREGGSERGRNEQSTHALIAITPRGPWLQKFRTGPCFSACCLMRTSPTLRLEGRTASRRGRRTQIVIFSFTPLNRFLLIFSADKLVKVPARAGRLDQIGHRDNVLTVMWSSTR